MILIVSPSGPSPDIKARAANLAPAVLKPTAGVSPCYCYAQQGQMTISFRRGIPSPLGAPAWPVAVRAQRRMLVIALVVRSTRHENVLRI
jgi:hypothetical protein